jgi:hypothetical protein
VVINLSYIKIGIKVNTGKKGKYTEEHQHFNSKQYKRGQVQSKGLRERKKMRTEWYCGKFLKVNSATYCTKSSKVIKSVH